MLIGLISDTHIPDRARIIPQNVIDAFEEVDLIIHAGDLTSPIIPSPKRMMILYIFLGIYNSCHFN